eukprot:EC122528.1.p1 GENE.EC122528.1~~EC122528.1.p1  ORF type:complete len:118 (+),score=2.55 EC122528.1:270-623(+)
MGADGLDTLGLKLDSLGATSATGRALVHTNCSMGALQRQDLGVGTCWMDLCCWRCIHNLKVALEWGQRAQQAAIQQTRAAPWPRCSFKLFVCARVRWISVANTAFTVEDCSRVGAKS